MVESCLGCCDVVSVMSLQFGLSLLCKFVAGSVACVYELPCFQHQYHLVATSVYSELRQGLE
jgi:hypothetical protein